MCGIIAIIDINKKTKSVNEKALDILDDQIGRGEKGFGATLLSIGKPIDIKRSSNLTRLLFEMQNPKNQRRAVILHHRQPTSSENKLSQTHPIVIDHPKLKYIYYLNHNGVIGEDKSLQKAQESQGYKYSTLLNNNINDSELFGVEMALFIENQKKRIDLSEDYGAFIMLAVERDTLHPQKIYFGHALNRPLTMQRTVETLTIASEGQSKDVAPDRLFCFSWEETKEKGVIVVNMLKNITTKPKGIPKITGFAAPAKGTPQNMYDYNRNYFQKHNKKPDKISTPPVNDWADNVHDDYENPPDMVELEYFRIRYEELGQQLVDNLLTALEYGLDTDVNKLRKEMLTSFSDLVNDNIDDFVRITQKNKL